jgi:hypothetical protein
MVITGPKSGIASHRLRAICHSLISVGGRGSGNAITVVVDATGPDRGCGAGIGSRYRGEALGWASLGIVLGTWALGAALALLEVDAAKVLPERGDMRAVDGPQRCVNWLVLDIGSGLADALCKFNTLRRGLHVE